MVDIPQAGSVYRLSEVNPPGDGKYVGSDGWIRDNPPLGDGIKAGDGRAGEIGERGEATLWSLHNHTALCKPHDSIPIAD